MPTHAKLQAEPRELMGKKVGRLRHQGILPATVYGPATTPQSIQVDAHAFAGVFRETGTTQLIDLVIGGQGALPVFVRQYQVDAKRNLIQHVEFLQPNLREIMVSHVPVHVVGDSPAARDGGMVLQVLDHLAIESLPDNVPAEGIEADISGITEINGALHVSDLALPEGVTVVTPGDEIVVKVNPPVAAEVVEELIEGTEPLPAELGGEEQPPDSVPEA